MIWKHTNLGTKFSFVGNAISPCFQPTDLESAAGVIKLVLWDGTRKTIMPPPSKHPRSGNGGRRVSAGEVMLEHACDHGMAVCPADSFFLGRPMPSLSTDEWGAPLVPMSSGSRDQRAVRVHQG
ncbi:hypothetical protein MLD38_003423 [Melastoma candidum]|uniref:Uncharacterized protein n=1 Tax=Melastoma candidum TaxID=119954 RepID=A0ACB9S4H8_9MYRT|nr:hypothetical protein MLD38_003423 [Melastoma candidum]